MRRGRWCWALLSMLVACAAHPAPPVAPDEPALAVLIDNKAFYDANVYVLANDAIIRKLGTVEGFTKRRFVLIGRQFAPGQQIALYAKTIGEAREYRSGAFSVFVGLGFRWALEDHGHEWLVPMSQAGTVTNLLFLY